MSKQSSLKFTLDSELPLDHDPNTKIRVKYDTSVSRMAATFYDALLVARKIGDRSSIAGIHPDAVLIAAQSGGKYKAAEAAEFVIRAHEQFQQAAMDHALKVAMLNDLFDVRDENGKRISGTKFPIEVPDDYWDDSEENEVRLMALLPPLPHRDSKNPIELRVAKVLTLLDENPILAQNFLVAFKNAFFSVIDIAIDIGLRETTSVDDDGFRPDDVGGDLDAAAESAGQVG